jgi:chromosomal replication initiator protein
VIRSLDPRMTFDRLVVAPGNRVAVGAARRAAEAPGRSYNPLVIHGPAGLGKTHLLHAIGQRAREVEPELSIRLEEMGEFARRLNAHLSAGTLHQFRAGFRDAGLLLLDDLHLVAGKARTQEELLRLLDETVAAGGQVVLTADLPPQEIPALDARLASRLSAGLTVDLAPVELGALSPGEPADEFGAFLSDISTAVAAVVESAPAEPEVATDGWFLDREKFAWDWVSIDDRAIEEHG